MLSSIANSAELASTLNERLHQGKGGQNYRVARMLGMLTRENQVLPAKEVPSKDRTAFAQTKYQFFLDAPFEISSQCCHVMKKQPLHVYGKKTGRHPITAQMASESRLRTQKWLQNGCNGFNLKEPISNPMSFWTEQDVLQYIYENRLPICSVYGDVVQAWEQTDDVEGQMTISDLAGFENYRDFDAEKPQYKTTGCDRTGCMLCGFGCHLEKPENSRFLRLKETHPKMYALLDVMKNNGVTMRQAIEWTNEHGNLHITI